MGRSRSGRARRGRGRHQAVVRDRDRHGRAGRAQPAARDAGRRRGGGGDRAWSMLVFYGGALPDLEDPGHARDAAERAEPARPRGGPRRRRRGGALVARRRRAARRRARHAPRRRGAGAGGRSTAIGCVLFSRGPRAAVGDAAGTSSGRCRSSRSAARGCWSRWRVAATVWLSIGGLPQLPGILHHFGYFPTRAADGAGQPQRVRAAGAMTRREPRLRIVRFCVVGVDQHARSRSATFAGCWSPLGCPAPLASGARVLRWAPSTATSCNRRWTFSGLARVPCVRCGSRSPRQPARWRAPAGCSSCTHARLAATGRRMRHPAVRDRRSVQRLATAGLPFRFRLSARSRRRHLGRAGRHRASCCSPGKLVGACHHAPADGRDARRRGLRAA